MDARATSPSIRSMTGGSESSIMSSSDGSVPGSSVTGDSVSSGGGIRFSSGSVFVVSSLVSVEAAGSASAAVSAAYTQGIRLTTSIRIKRSEIHRLITVGIIFPFKNSPCRSTARTVLVGLLLKPAQNWFSFSECTGSLEGVRCGEGEPFRTGSINLQNGQTAPL